MEPVPVEIPFPHGGMNEAHAYGEQPPLTSPDMLNVRRMGVSELRKRGGSRPGLTRAFDQQLESGAQIDMLSSVSYASAGDLVWTDEFAQVSSGYQLLSDFDPWAAASWVFHGSPKVYSIGRVHEVCTATREVGAVRDLFSFNLSDPYFVEMELVPHLGAWGGRYKLWARMNNTTPAVETSGVEAELEMEGTSGAYTFRLRVNGSQVATSSGTKTVQAAWFRMKIDGNDVEITWAGTTVASQTVASHSTNVRVGFGLEAFFGTPGTKYLSVERFQLRNLISDVGPRTRLVAVANGKLYREFEGSLELAATGLTTGRPLMAAEHLSKLYIANWSPSSNLNPQVYNPVTNTMGAVVATAGTRPGNCPIVVRYSDRLWWAGERDNPHLWYASRQGDSLDYDYAQVDAQSAIAGQNVDGGNIGEPLTGLAPVGDDYMIMGCLRSLWVMRGDPGYGGAIENISREIGLLDKFAHCLTPDGHWLFMTSAGLYVLPPGAQREPEEFSRLRMPKQWLSLDPDQFIVSMRFSVQENGVHIFVTDSTGGSSKHYFMDWEAKAFIHDLWPVTMDPIVSYSYTASSLPHLSGRVLAGGRDGYIRTFSTASALDDGTEIDSHVIIGPIPLGHDAGLEAILNEIIATLPIDGGVVDWSLHVGMAPEDALVAEAVASGEWSGNGTHGVQYRERPRARGGAAYLKLANGASGVPWQIEKIHGLAIPCGLQRLS